MEPAKAVWVRRRPVERFLPDPKAKLRDQVHEVCRFKRFSTRTEETDWGWIHRFLRFHRSAGVWRHPNELNSSHVRDYLSHLAVERKVSAATQNQALNALVFLFQTVLARDPELFGEFERARCSRS